MAFGEFDSHLPNMKKYTKEEIKDAINKSYERNSFNVAYFWKHLTGEYE